jgi:cell division initiation protein
VPLTPADIHAQQFRVVFRGYEIGEVDAFLDRLEEELTRLWSASARGDEVPTGADHRPAPPPAAAAGHLGDPAAGGTREDEAASRVLRTLLRAEQMAERTVADAIAEADEIRARARAEAEVVLADARTEASQVSALMRKRSQGEVDDLVARGRRLRAHLDRLGEQERRCREALRTWLEEHEALFDQRPPAASPAPAAQHLAVPPADTVVVRHADAATPLVAVR